MTIIEWIGVAVWAAMLIAAPIVRRRRKRRRARRLAEVVDRAGKTSLPL